MPERDNKKARKKFSLSSHDIWLLSSLFSIVAIFAALLFMALRVYGSALDLFYTANEKLVQKTGLEVATDISTTTFNEAKDIISKKDKLPGAPEITRNVFYYEAYFNGSPEAPAQPTTNPLPAPAKKQ